MERDIWKTLYLKFQNQQLQSGTADNTKLLAQDEKHNPVKKSAVQLTAFSIPNGYWQNSFSWLITEARVNQLQVYINH